MFWSVNVHGAIQTPSSKIQLNPVLAFFSFWFTFFHFLTLLQTQTCPCIQERELRGKKAALTKRAKRERKMSGNDKTTAMDLSFKLREREQALKMAGQPLKIKPTQKTTMRQWLNSKYCAYLHIWIHLWIDACWIQQEMCNLSDYHQGNECRCTVWEDKSTSCVHIFKLDPPRSTAAAKTVPDLQHYAITQLKKVWVSQDRSINMRFKPQQCVRLHAAVRFWKMISHTHSYISTLV